MTQRPPEAGEEKMILVSEREWQEVVGGILALRTDYVALAMEHKKLKERIGLVEPKREEP